MLHFDGNFTRMRHRVTRLQIGHETKVEYIVLVRVDCKLALVHIFAIQCRMSFCVGNLLAIKITLENIYKQASNTYDKIGTDSD